MYTHNALAQIINTGIANAGISGAVMASSGTGSYNSNGGFVFFHYLTKLSWRRTKCLLKQKIVF
jgi:hypothetical protein